MHSKLFLFLFLLVEIQFSLSRDIANDNEIDEDDADEASFPQLISPRANQLIAPYAEVPLEYRRVCIYPNWSILRDSNMAKIYPEDIPADLCTHIHYAYANIDVRTLQLTPSQYQDFNSGDHGAPLYERIIKLRETNPNLKILISIGGWFAKSTPFNTIITSDTTRNTFIENAVNFLRHWKFDGLDIQWEYPGDVEYGASPDSKQRFTSLIKHLNKAFKEEYKTNFKRYIVTAFVPADESRIDAGYQVKQVCKFLDYVSVATYDYTGPYDTKTGYNSPLYSRTQVQNSVNSSIHHWLQRGCPAKKLLVGIPSYARAFKIIKRSNSPSLLFLGIESEPFVSPSIYTSEEGILSYYEVCEMMSNKETRVYWDDLAEVPFAIVSNQKEASSDSSENSAASNLWISYEDARSARKKVEYVKKMALGGVSMWSLDMDDFKGLFCNLGSFPIIESVKEEFEHKITLINAENNEEDNEEQHEEITTEEVLNEEEVDEKNVATNNHNPSLTTKENSISNLNNKSNKKGGKDKGSNSTSNKKNSNINEENEVLESFARKLKKFKAVREIKLIACLDAKMCNLNSSYSSYLSFSLTFIFLNQIFCYLIFKF